MLHPPAILHDLWDCLELIFSEDLSKDATFWRVFDETDNSFHFPDKEDITGLKVTSEWMEELYQPLDSDVNVKLLWSIAKSIGFKLMHLDPKKFEPLFRAICRQDILFLLKFEVDYSSYDCTEVILVRQVLALFSKNAGHVTNDDCFSDVAREIASVETLLRANAKAKAFNRRLAFKPVDDTLMEDWDLLQSKLLLVSREMGALLGTPPSWERVITHGQLSSGSAVCTIRSTRAGKKRGSTILCAPREFTSIQVLAKLGSDRSCSYAVNRILDRYWPIQNAPYEMRGGRTGNVFGRVFTVKKNIETVRPAVMTSRDNGFLQRALGRLIRRRLNKVGILLPSQQLFHQLLAREGSGGDGDDDWVTLDLADASSSIAGLLPGEVTPPGWYEKLYTVRDHYLTMPLVFGKGVRGQKQFKDQMLFLAKHGEEYSGQINLCCRFQATEAVIPCHFFSTMGNGFTFEYETALFLSIIKAGIKEEFGENPEVFVYGDDIILKKRHAETAMRWLSALGMEVNVKKTHLTGSFRESCGGYFFKKTPVRPFYVTDTFSPARLIGLANWLRDKEELVFLRDIVISHIPSQFRVYGPPLTEDGHIWDDDWRLKQDLSERNLDILNAGWETSWYFTFEKVPLSDTQLGLQHLSPYDHSVLGYFGQKYFYRDSLRSTGDDTVEELARLNPNVKALFEFMSVGRPDFSYVNRLEMLVSRLQSFLNLLIS